MLAGKTLLAVGWTVASRIGTRLLDVVTVLVLARFLTPEDFGLVALATSVVAITETVLEISLSQVLSRLPTVEKRHLDTAFTLGVIRGVLLGAVLAATALPFARAYGDDRLLPLVLALAIAPIARGLYNPAMVKFTRDLRFREAFVGSIASKVFSSIAAISVALIGGGYWAIATGAIAAATGATLISYAQAPYRPRLSLSESQHFFGFLGWFSVTQLLSAVSWQLDRFVLGYFVSKTDLGRYTMASDLAVLPTQTLINAAWQPLMSAFATLKDDEARLRAAYLKATRLTMLLAMPACVYLSIASHHIVGVLFDKQWEIAGEYLRWIALTTTMAGYFQPIQSLSVVMHRMQAVFHVILAEFLLRVILIAPAIYFAGVEGAVAARAGVAAVTFLSCLFVAKRLTEVEIVEQLRNIKEAALASAAMAAVMIGLIRLLDQLNILGFADLALITAAGGLTYLTALFLLRVPVFQLLNFRQR